MISKITIPLITLAALTFAPNSGAQTNPPVSPAPNASTAKAPGLHFSPGTILPVELDKSVDAKKAKPGDPVVAKIDQDLLSNGKIVIPRNSKVMGRVVEVKPSTHDDKSSKLGIVFDKIEVKDAPEIPLSAEVQGIGAPVSAVGGNTYGDDMGGPSSGNPGGTTGSSPMGGSSSAGSNPSGPAMGSASPNMPNSQAGASMPSGQKSAPLPRNFQGVRGLRGLTLSQGPMQDSLLSSQDHNVKLDSGTQILLRAK
ncbi:MAG TPA: hypothetical protein VGG46_16100 [Terriglobales bacterium]|jgi:hypothetical protein